MVIPVLSLSTGETFTISPLNMIVTLDSVNFLYQVEVMFFYELLSFYYRWMLNFVICLSALLKIIRLCVTFVLVIWWIVWFIFDCWTCLDFLGCDLLSHSSKINVLIFSWGNSDIHSRGTFICKFLLCDIFVSFWYRVELTS